MNPRWGVALAAVCAKAVRAGIMASSSGNARAVPTPRSTVRRVRCFLVLNISNDSLYSLPGGHLRGLLLYLLHYTGLERRRRDNPHHDRRESVIIALGI